MYKFLILICMCVTSFTLAAQEETKNHDRKISMEEMQKKQLEHFTKELDLDQEQSDKLAPILQQYMLDRFKLFHKAHKKPGEMTESGYKEAVENMLATKTKETELQNEFYNSMLKILPAEKVYKYHSVERKYFRDAMQKRKHKQK